MTFALWTVALAIATLGQIGNGQLCGGIGRGKDICTYKRPANIPRLPLVIRPVELPRPVIEISTPEPTPAPPAPPTLAPLPVPPLLPLGGPCSCKRTLVRPAIVPKPVCQCQQKCVTVCNSNSNQQTVTNNRVVVGGGCSSSIGGGYSSGVSGVSSGILGSASALVGEAVDSLFGGDSSASSSILSSDDSIGSIIGGSDSIGSIIGGSDSIGSILGASGLLGDASTIVEDDESPYSVSDSILEGLGSIVDSSRVGGSSFIESSAYGGNIGGGILDNVNVLGDDSTVVQTSLGGGTYVDTIVGGRRRCVNVPYNDDGDVGETDTRRDTSQLPADAVSLAIAYNLAKKACEQSEDKLFYGFRQIPKEVPRRVINRRIIGRRFQEEGSLYGLNGEVVELKAPSAVTTQKSLAEEAAEDLLDLVAEEQEQGSDYVLPIRKVTLGEIGYAPAKRRSPSFIDIPSEVSDAADDVADAVSDAVDAVKSQLTCSDGFRAGNVAVLPVPQRELMLSRPKLEHLLEPCSSEEEYGPVPQAVQYTSCNRRSSRRSSSSSSSGLLSKIVAKLA